MLKSINDLRTVALCSILVLGAASEGFATLIDFETLPGGTPVTFGAPVGASYASLGVVFSGGSLTGQPLFRPANSLNAGVSPPSSFIATLSRASSGTFNVIASFSLPVFDVASDVIGALGTTITMTAFDSSNNVLGSTTSPSNVTNHFLGNLSLASATPIASVEWVSSSPIGAIAGVDNLRFNAVPGPSGLLLLSTGLLALARHTRRRSDSF